MHLPNPSRILAPSCCRCCCQREASFSKLLCVFWFRERERDSQVCFLRESKTCRSLNPIPDERRRRRGEASKYCSSLVSSWDARVPSPSSLPSFLQVAWEHRSKQESVFRGKQSTRSKISGDTSGNNKVAPKRLEKGKE